MAIEALVTLRSENVPAVGRERLKLLEAVARGQHFGRRTCHRHHL